MKSILTRSIIIVSLIAGATKAHAHFNPFEPKVVETLVQPYLNIQQALAADKLTEAHMEAQALKTAATLARARSRTPDIAKLRAAVAAILASKDLPTARAGFLALSKEMQPLIEHVGTTNKTDLFVLHCSMAFDGQGASWIQDDRMVANPYYGPRMLRCGSAQNQIAKGSGQIEGHASNRRSSEEAKLMPASAALIEAQGSSYPDMCVVSDEPLVEGEIQEFSYQGELVRFCCKGCSKDFMEDPEGYMTKLHAMKSASSHEAPGATAHDHANHSH